MGYLSHKGTRKIEENKKDENYCQVIGQYIGKQKNDTFGDILIVSSDYYNIPVKYIFKDTLKFYLVVNKDMHQRDTIGKIKVWDK